MLFFQNPSGIAARMPAKRRLHRLDRFHARKPDSAEFPERCERFPAVSARFKNRVAVGGRTI
jgi:hypothetical protein